MTRTKLTPHRRERLPSPRERIVGFSLLILLAGAVGLFFLAGTGGEVGFAPPSPRPASPGAAEPLPLRSPGGWVRGGIESYDPQSVFEKINGKADAYFAFDFEALDFASYANPEDPDEWVDVYLYDMGEPQNAYGMYRAERTGKEPPVDIGDEGCAPGGAVFARRGSVYIQALPGSDAAAEEALAIARTAAEAIPAPAEPPRDPDWFPADGLTLIRYELRDCLMIPSLVNAHVAIYEDGAKAVVADLGSPEEAEAAAAEAVESLEFLGTFAVFRTIGGRAVGIVGAPDEVRAADLLEEVARRLGEER